MSQTKSKRRVISVKQSIHFPVLCVDGLHQQCVQRRAKLRRPGRPEHQGFYFGPPRAGLQREAVLLLVESRQETRPHTNTEQRYLITI